MHLEILVGAVAKELRAAWPEVGKPADVLFGRQGRCLMEMDCGHASSFFGCHQILEFTIREPDFLYVGSRKYSSLFYFLRRGKCRRIPSDELLHAYRPSP